MKEENLDPIEDLKNIRNMMERSSKFLSLSGLSGIFAGLIAIGGAFVAYTLIHRFEIHALSYGLSGNFDHALDQLTEKLIFTAMAVLVLALSVGFLFTYIKAKKNNQNLNHPIAYKVLWSILIPLIFGGLFTLLLLKNGAYFMVAPATLIFYGLALLNSSNYLNIEIKYLALTQLILGLLAGFYTQNGLLFWTIGFGVMHIFYGAIMYFKYDRS